MKKIYIAIPIIAILLTLGGCDQNFVEINTDPFAITKIDPALLFANAQRIELGGWESEHTVVQHFVNPFNDGATLAFNFNEDIDNFSNDCWNMYTGQIKHLIHVLYLLEGTTDKVNLQSMARIMKAFAFMKMVDHYCDVPYSDAGAAYIKGENYFFPKYDNDEDIYQDLYNELKDAISKLNPSGDYVSADLFYGSHAFNKVTDVATQVAKWKKFGNSILLRLGMRYSKVNPTKAAQIVAEAFNGGVMSSNADNAFVIYDGTLYTNGKHNNLINNNPRFYYAAEPLVNKLKATNDPRAKYLIAMYDDPNNPLGDTDPDYTLANQYGVPVGVAASSLANAPYRGKKGSGYDYSQMNVRVFASIKAPSFYMTYAQTALLLAEAAKRGWISGGDATAQQYYEAAIRADMDNYSLYLSQTSSSLPSVSTAEKDAYIAQAGVAYDSNNALNQINTQYWIVSLIDGSEAWANFRRSGFPTLSRNSFNNNLLADGGDGFVHRFSYPDAELTRNKINYENAVTAIGGKDNLIARTFWDIP